MCNPFGGLGLTGGIVDVGGLYDCLAGIYDDKADPSILDTYSDIRRQKYNDIVNPISTENLLRMFEDPETALEQDEFLKMCKKTETDKEFSKAVQSGVNVLKYDFTQHYRPAERPPMYANDEKTNGVQVSQPMGVAVAGVSD